VHGLGARRLDVRRRFLREVAGRLEELGFRFTDSAAGPLRYGYVIEDCHWDPGRAVRFVYDDFREPPRFVQRNRSHLVLTHPGYWTPRSAG
jgi:hypothetical protein